MGFPPEAWFEETPASGGPVLGSAGLGLVRGQGARQGGEHHRRGKNPEVQEEGM